MSEKIEQPTVRELPISESGRPSVSYADRVLHEAAQEAESALNSGEQLTESQINLIAYALEQLDELD